MVGKGNRRHVFIAEEGESDCRPVHIFGIWDEVRMADSQSRAAIWFVTLCDLVQDGVCSSSLWIATTAS
jgi:hypothetical protein